MSGDTNVMSEADTLSDQIKAVVRKRTQADANAAEARRDLDGLLDQADSLKERADKLPPRQREYVRAALREVMPARGRKAASR